MDVSLQLYSARNHTPWEAVIKSLADLGYTQVEGFGPVYEDPSAFRAVLDANGMTMPSGHFPLVGFEDGFANTLETARTLGMELMICPAVPHEDRKGDAAHWTAIGKRLAEACRKVRDAGLRFGWHNHNFEFADIGGESRPMDILLAEAPDMEWEVDIAWIIEGDEDAIAWIDRYADRITAAHFKDIAPKGENVDEDGWADLGFGTLDLESQLEAAKRAGVDLFVLEHDKPSDFARFARRSIETFRKL